MTEAIIVPLIFLFIIVILAALLYAAGRGYIAGLAGLAELRATLSRVLADIQEIEYALLQQQRLIFEAQKRRCTTVTKGLEKLDA